MANSPSLNIPLLDENQAAKEATINTGLLRFEGATQRSLTVTFTANAATLTNTEFTSYFRFMCTSLTAAGTLTIPQEINLGAPTERFFIVTNTSDQTLTVQGDAAGSYVVQPSTSAFIYSSGTDVASVSIELPFDYLLNDFSDVYVPTPTDNQFLRYNEANARWEAATVAVVGTFLGLTDTPPSFTGNESKGLRVNAAGNAIEFFTLNINSLSDVDTTTAAPTDGQVLTWDELAGNWIPESPTGGGASSLNDLTDVDLSTPPTANQVLAFDDVSSTFKPVDQSGGGGTTLPSYTGNAGKVLAVNATEDNVEWVDDQTGGGGGAVDLTSSATSRNIVVGDLNTTILATAAQTLTIPTGVTATIGATFNVAATVAGDGQVLLAAGAGATINSAGGALSLRTQYSSATLIQTATDVWLLIGDIA